MKHLRRFNEAGISNPHAWRNRPAPEKQTDMLDIVRGGDIDALEGFLKANEGKLKKLVNQAVKFSAPGTRNENKAIFDYVMDRYVDLVDFEEVNKWLRHDKAAPVADPRNGRDIDEHGNDWYYFDHPEDMK